jgi:tetratricopeptide (TPR) repeat protein
VKRISLFAMLIVLTVLSIVLPACQQKAPGGDATSHLEAGKSASDARDYERAITELQTAIAMDPKLAEAQFRLGNVYAEQNRSTEAEQAYKKALALTPSDADVLSNLGVVYYHMGRLDDAVTQFREALKYKANDADIHYNLGGVYVQQSQWDAALAEFETAKSLKPDLPEVYLGFGFVYKEQGRKDEAIQALEKFVTMTSDPQWQTQAEQMLSELRGSN